MNTRDVVRGLTLLVSCYAATATERESGVAQLELRELGDGRQVVAAERTPQSALASGLPFAAARAALLRDRQVGELSDDVVELLAGRGVDGGKYVGACVEEVLGTTESRGH